MSQVNIGHWMMSEDGPLQSLDLKPLLKGEALLMESMWALLKMKSPWQYHMLPHFHMASDIRFQFPSQPVEILNALLWCVRKKHLCPVNKILKNENGTYAVLKKKTRTRQLCLSVYFTFMTLAQQSFWNFLLKRKLTKQQKNIFVSLLIIKSKTKMYD